MFGQSPFGSGSPPEVNIPEDAEVVFVSDMFIEDYVGGAELTSEALIQSSPFNVFKLHARDVDFKLLEDGQDKHWVFGNFASMNMELIPTICANMRYSILEYDYKYCKYRSPEKHTENENVPCDCHDQINGKMISAFYYGAKSLWWMSERQEMRYHEKFPFLEEINNVVLSSVFDDHFFLTLKILKKKYKDHEKKGWIVLGSSSWIKGADDAIAWCKDNDKDFEVLWDTPYEHVLEQLAQSEGFVYLPKGGDTCPRMVIEAKLLGCELHLNDFVEHKDELWFDTDDEFDTEAYLYAARERFWSGIKSDMEWCPTLSGYTTTLNCIKHDYPWQASIESMLNFCDEVVVMDGGSEDGTWEQLQEWAETEEKLNVHQVKRDWNHPRFAVYDGANKALSRAKCTMDFCWQQDADEVVHEDDFEKIKRLMISFPGNIDIVCLPVVEYWGGEEKVRMDINPWKWRISRNMPHITHGIPGQLRQQDADGNLYSSPGTDGCDYIDTESYEPVPHATFYNAEAHQCKVSAMEGDQVAMSEYSEWFGRCVELLPSVHHYSWFNLPRKIKTYRDYWSQHWQSLYNIPQDDIAENNMFFQKPWVEVSDEDIDNLSVRLRNETGGWVFHSPIDFSKTVPHVTLDTDHPKFVWSWLGREIEVEKK